MNTIRHILQIKGNDLWSISPNATVFEALRLMAAKDVGALHGHRSGSNGWHSQ
jgi:hypothetical protein